MTAAATWSSSPLLRKVTSPRERSRKPIGPPTCCIWPGCPWSASRSPAQEPCSEEKSWRYCFSSYRFLVWSSWSPAATVKAEAEEAAEEAAAGEGGEGG